MQRNVLQQSAPTPRACRATLRWAVESRTRTGVTRVRSEDPCVSSTCSSPGGPRCWTIRNHQTPGNPSEASRSARSEGWRFCRARLERRLLHRRSNDSAGGPEQRRGRGKQLTGVTRTTVVTTAPTLLFSIAKARSLVGGVGYGHRTPGQRCDLYPGLGRTRSGLQIARSEALWHAGNHQEKGEPGFGLPKLSRSLLTQVRRCTSRPGSSPSGGWRTHSAVG